MPSSLAEYSTHAREDEMRERRDNAVPGCIFLLMAIALVGTFLQALINSALAPMNASWLLMAARACAIAFVCRLLAAGTGFGVEAE
jgi:hypothetical protein